MLAYFGGTRVRTRDRELRTEAGEPGWLVFEIEGRTAKRVGPADPATDGLPKLRGVLVGALFFCGTAERVRLMPSDEPPMFASATCYRWHDGTVVFGELDFEGEVEEAARTALAERRGIAWVKGASSQLRAAFGWAVASRVAREKKIPLSVREAWPRLGEIADEGDDAAGSLLEHLEEMRHGPRVVVAGEAIRLRRVIERATEARGEATLANAAERAETALGAAGARVLAIRRLDGGRHLEVRFEFGGETFVALADALTLNVIDAGICLVDHGDGHRGDEDLTLDSLPSAIREAIDLGVLVITRR